MSGYRRAEPAYCRGCGARWSPGADACACGESLVAAPVAGGDPLPVRKLGRALGAIGVVLALRWAGATLAFNNEVFFEWSIQAAILGVPVLLALVTAPWWYPGRFGPTLGRRPSVGAWLVALALGVGLAAAAFFLQGETFGVIEVGAEFGWWVAVLFAAIVIEELLFRGLLFDGVAAFGGRVNAAIASVLLFALYSFDPFDLLFVVGAAGLRGWSGSVLPAIVVRLVATFGLLLACGAFAG